LLRIQLVVSQNIIYQFQLPFLFEDHSIHWVFPVTRIMFFSFKMKIMDLRRIYFTFNERIGWWHEIKKFRMI
jgi:hypothetical protein